VSDELISPDLPPDFATTVRIARLATTATNLGRLRSDVQVRHFQLAVDEPPERGGDDAGPSPLEYVLLGLAGGLGVSFRLVAEGMRFSYSRLDVEVEAEFDRRGRFGVPGIKPFFQVCRVQVSVRTSESDERLARAAELVRRTSPIDNLLRAAGVDLSVAFNRR
jgi:uncharacterized OsmC-like protein